MTASINDKFRKANNGTLALPAQLSATKQTIDTTASLSLATGWPTDTAIDIQIYKVGTDGKVVAGSVTHWIATLSGTTLSNMTLTGGTNQAYATGDTVVLMPNPKWANDLVDGVLEEHKQDGSHGAVTATSVTTTDAITAGNGLNVTGPVSLPAGSLSTPAYGDGTVTPAKWTNPYKFSVYRSAALNSSSTATRVDMDTKLYDTNSNVDVVTNKGRFTAPVTGYYHFSGACGNTVATGVIFASLYKNGTRAKVGSIANGGAGQYSQVSGDLYLTAGQYVELYFVGGGGSVVAVGADSCYFDGHLVSLT